VQHHYDEVANIYDRQYDAGQGRAYYSHICDMVLEPLPRGGTLLDLGCGTGLFMRRYEELGGRTIGLDISRGMITRARDRCGKSDVILGTAERLPFRENTFDGLSSLLAFSYLQHPEQMLADSFRVLKPGGSISICTLGRNAFTSLIPLIYRVGEHLRIRRVGMAYFGEHYYADDELTALFERIGFEAITIRRCSFAHVDMGNRFFSVTRKAEPFIEKRMPYLAFNICASAKKPKN
jgi:ubiquinone/menaquinone biosynthesis C-methylase UbiE